MLNELRQDRAGNARFVKTPSTVLAGDPLLVGNEAGVAVDNYNSANGGTTVRFSGTFALTVIAATTVSPLVGEACQQGNIIYASGTLDSTTNVTTGLTLSKQSSGGTVFGHYDSTTDLASGTTSTTAPVKLKEGQ